MITFFYIMMCYYSVVSYLTYVFPVYSRLCPIPAYVILAYSLCLSSVQFVPFYLVSRSSLCLSSLCLSSLCLSSLSLSSLCPILDCVLFYFVSFLLMYFQFAAFLAYFILACVCAKNLTQQCHRISWNLVFLFPKGHFIYLKSTNVGF